MNIKRSFVSISLSTLIIALGVTAVWQPLTAFAEPPGHRSTSPVFWWWDEVTEVGRASLLRTPQGISATFHTSGLPAGHAVTLWFIIFNNPAACFTNPCIAGVDLFNPDAAADFIYAGGHVVGGPRNTFAGHLQVGDSSGSGFNEFGVPELAIGLSNPMGAEVLLALHSHGPAMTGQDLVAQIGSFTGGCDDFLGPGGFAAGFGDIPVNFGECSTMQFSLHQP